MRSCKPILLVDDDDDVRELVTMVLEVEGYVVESAESGFVALDRLRSLEPSVILLDMNMPGMNGWEFAHSYRAQAGPYAPVVVFTGGHVGSDVVQQIDADAFVTKPFDLNDLLAVVGRYAARTDGGALAATISALGHMDSAAKVTPAARALASR
ncbi:MAG: response regulator [Chloroflexi bacterium]|nr:response regulator [Chloroflexota bacterium]